MNRYLAFAYDNYYPDGGWEDFIGAYPSLDAAKEAALAKYRGQVYCDAHWHVVDAETRAIVADGTIKTRGAEPFK